MVAMMIFACNAVLYVQICAIYRISSVLNKLLYYKHSCRQYIYIYSKLNVLNHLFGSKLFESESMMQSAPPRRKLLCNLCEYISLCSVDEWLCIFCSPYANSNASIETLDRPSKIRFFLTVALNNVYYVYCYIELTCFRCCFYWVFSIEMVVVVCVVDCLPLGRDEITVLMLTSFPQFDCECLKCHCKISTINGYCECVRHLSNTLSPHFTLRFHNVIPKCYACFLTNSDIHWYMCEICIHDMIGPLPENIIGRKYTMHRLG